MTDIKDWVEAVGVNSGLLADAARKAGLEAQVRTCPDWDVAGLVTHIGKVHRWVQSIFDTKAQELPGRPSGPGDGEDLLAWFEAGAGELRATLAAADPTEPVWNWSAGAPEPSRFWIRRMAHETAIHRVDAESATGQASIIEPPELAVDGIDEFFSVLPARHARDENMQSFEGSFHFHATDVPGEWMLEFEPGTLQIRREHAKAAVAARGPASALELFVYNRGPADDLEIHGDDALLNQWRERIRF